MKTPIICRGPAFVVNHQKGDRIYLHVAFSRPNKKLFNQVSNVFHSFCVSVIQTPVVVSVLAKRHILKAYRMSIDQSKVNPSASQF